MKNLFSNLLWLAQVKFDVSNIMLLLGHIDKMQSYNNEAKIRGQSSTKHRANSYDVYILSNTYLVHLSFYLLNSAKKSMMDLFHSKYIIF